MTHQMKITYNLCSAPAAEGTPDERDSARHIWNKALIWKVCHLAAAPSGTRTVDGQTMLSYQCPYIWVSCRDTFCQTSGRLGTQHCSITHLSRQGRGHAHPQVTVSTAHKNSSCHPPLNNGPAAAVTLSRSSQCQAQRWTTAYLLLPAAISIDFL